MSEWIRPGKIVEVGGMPAAQEAQETIRDLRHKIADKALQLSDLEVILEDCRGKRQVLLRDLRALREKLWDLRDRPTGPTPTRPLG